MPPGAANRTRAASAPVATSFSEDTSLQSLPLRYFQRYA
jgi:hypothetical protein